MMIQPHEIHKRIRHSDDFQEENPVQDKRSIVELQEYWALNSPHKHDRVTPRLTPPRVPVR